MPVRSAAVLLLALASASFAAPPGPKVKYPSKLGIYAMTSDGPVELKVSGEPNEIAGAIRLQSYYSPADLDKIPKVASVRSFYVSRMDWALRRVYLVVGRDGLVNSLDHFQMLSTSTISRGAVAFEVVSPDLIDPSFIVRSARSLAPAGKPDSEIEAYLVLELKSTSGLSPRNYPVQVVLPAQ